MESKKCDKIFLKIYINFEKNPEFLFPDNKEQLMTELLPS